MIYFYLTSASNHIEDQDYCLYLIDSKEINLDPSENHRFLKRLALKNQWVFLKQLGQKKGYSQYFPEADLGKIIARIGSIEMMTWFIEQRFSPKLVTVKSNLYHPCFSCPSTKTETLVPEDEQKWVVRIYRTMAKYGRLEMIIWLRSKGDRYRFWSNKIFDTACFYGHFDLLEWIWVNHQSVFLKERSEPLVAAIKAGRIDILNWLVDHGFDPKLHQWELFVVAAGDGRINILAWLIELGLEPDYTAINAAARSGSIETVQWLFDHHCETAENLIEHGTKSGNRDMIRYLRSKGVEWTAGLSGKIAKQGDLEFLQWLVSEGCPISEYTCFRAAASGHLHILIWLRAQNCPWNILTLDVINRSGNSEMLKWAIDNQCPGYEQLQTD